MEELGIDDCYQGGLDKMKSYGEILEKHGLQDEEVSFIGDDLIDTSVMEKVGMAIAVQNAHPFIKEIAHFTTEKAGGEGALREAVELILKGQGVYDETLRRIRERIKAGDE
jgi:3-deoxy-D-manno-octulosonate 8-phosphate phosphatase (KDO 8-P phosphatase)